ncbi:hypothetical protein D9M70_492300 [compost metagenome]
MRLAAAARKAPAIIAISKPPNVASTSSGACASACSASAASSTSRLRASPASSSPVPRPMQSASGSPVSRCIRHAAAEVLAMPISPKPITLQPCWAWRSTRAMPAVIAAAACSGVIAGSCAKLRVPSAMRQLTSPGAAGSGTRTPASTISSAMPCWRENTLIAAPPARKFLTICAVTSAG